MTTDTITPVLSWRHGQLVTADGVPVTDAQDHKASAYVKRCLIQRLTTTESPGWGVPWVEAETFRLDPIPGCRQERRVVVRTHHNGDGTTAGRDYACECQHSRGTVSQRPGACSHTLAVHRFLGGAP